MRVVRKRWRQATSVILHLIPSVWSIALA